MRGGLVWVATICLTVCAASCPAPAARLTVRLLVRADSSVVQRKLLLVKRACESAASFTQRVAQRVGLPEESSIRLSPPFEQIAHNQPVTVDRVGIKGCPSDQLQCVGNSLSQAGVAVLDNAVDVRLVEGCRAAFMPQLDALLTKMDRCGVDRRKSFRYHEVRLPGPTHAPTTARIGVLPEVQPVGCALWVETVRQIGPARAGACRQGGEAAAGRCCPVPLNARCQQCPSMQMRVYVPISVPREVKQSCALGSQPQNWHTDGAHYANNSNLYALTVYVPLVDLEDTLGPTMFVLGSHKHEQLRAGAESAAILTKRGGVVLWDYRTVHWGLPNKSNFSRPVLYLAFGGRWFHDNDNAFPRCSLFEQNCRCK